MPTSIGCDFIERGEEKKRIGRSSSKGIRPAECAEKVRKQWLSFATPGSIASETSIFASGHRGNGRRPIGRRTQ